MRTILISTLAAIVCSGMGVGASSQLYAASLEELELMLLHPKLGYWSTLKFSTPVSSEPQYAHISIAADSGAPPPQNHWFYDLWQYGAARQLKYVRFSISNHPENDDAAPFVLIRASELQIAEFPIINAARFWSTGHTITTIQDDTMQLDIYFGDPVKLSACAAHLNKTQPEWKDQSPEFAERDTLVIRFDKNLGYEIEVEPGLCHDFEAAQ